MSDSSSGNRRRTRSMSSQSASGASESSIPHVLIQSPAPNNDSTNTIIQQSHATPMLQDDSSHATVQGIASAHATVNASAHSSTTSPSSQLPSVPTTPHFISIDSEEEEVQTTG